MSFLSSLLEDADRELAERYRREVSLEEPNWQPEPFLGPKGLEDRDKVFRALHRESKNAAVRLREPDAGEFRDGYLERVQRRVKQGLPEPPCRVWRW